MATTMNALNSASIRHAEFIRLDVDGTPYTFCNAAASITVNSITFTGLGALISVGDVQRDIKATSDDFAFSLTGIDPAYVALILSADIKGSIVEMWRGFLDSNNQIITVPTQQFFKRYQGIVNSVQITEEFKEQQRERVATLTVACASFRQILENRMAGIRTNPQSWQLFYPNDTSMDRTPIIQNQYFDFGKEPKSGGQASPDPDAADNSPTVVTTPNNEGG
jgi:hypothetical protein